MSKGDEFLIYLEGACRWRAAFPRNGSRARGFAGFGTKLVPLAYDLPIHPKANREAEREMRVLVVEDQPDIAALITALM